MKATEPIPMMITGINANLSILKRNLQTFAMVFALLGIWLIFSFVTNGAFLEARNLSNLFRQMAITGLLANGMVLVIVAGHIDLSVSSTVCFLGAFIAILTTNLGLSPGTAVGLSIILGTVIGIINGYLVAYQKIPAFIVTLGGMMLFRGASMWITAGNTIPLADGWIKDLGTGYLPTPAGWGLSGIAVLLIILNSIRSQKERKLHELPLDSRPLLVGKILVLGSAILIFMSIMAAYEGVPLPVLVLVVTALLFNFISRHTTFGRHIFAIGGNSEAAYLSGIPVKRTVLLVFGLMGILAALAGLILTARVGSASPDAGQLLELDAIAACVIGGTSLMGGRGSVFGAILGALVMESLNNGMSMANMESFWQYIVKGSVLVVAVWLDNCAKANR